MKSKILLILGFLIIFSCKTNPFTGKKTLNFMPNSQVFPMAFAQYNQFLEKNPVIRNSQNSQMVKRVGQRIAKAAEIWLNANGYRGYLKDYRWEYNLINSREVNAWCMPGGKIVVYTGILPVTQSETGLAVVIGHEIAHALANHGAQRMSAGTLQQLGAVVGNVVLQNSKYKKYTNQFNLAYGIGTHVGVMLPFSRSHEAEADAIGIQLMAIAGYNPEEAPNLWRRMQAKSGKANRFELLSTHPSSDSRISHLTSLIPEAKAKARKFGIKTFK